MGFALVIGTLLAAFCSWNAITLVLNYIRARQIGLPILITPVTSMNIIWYLLEGYLTPVLRHVPFGITNFLDYSTTDWNFNDKYRLHAKYGPAFTIVSPGLFMIILADPPAIQDIYARRNDYIKHKDLYKGLEIFGENVDTVNGQKWQRQRKITAPPFNERNSGLVWRETGSQAQVMLKKWTDYGSDGVPRMDRDTLTLALHVLCGAGFGKFYAFDGEGISSPGKGHDMSYKEALKTILDNIILAIAFGSMNLPAKYLPPRFKKIPNAMSEFRKYLTEMVEDERRATARTTENDNLMSALVRASDNEALDEKGNNGLTDDELLGNMFIYNVAGHHTTALTLTYAFAMMATNPTWQSWIREEINHVIGTDDESSKYEKAFPQLKRCLAVQFETLRLYGPIIVNPRYTDNSPALLNIGGKEYLIPAHTHVMVNHAGVQAAPLYWGSDAEVWRPGRWIVDSTKGNLKSEELITPLPGTFVPWSSGPRVCPGRKFAQVEFVAAFASLFKNHEVRPVQLKGESQKAAADRVKMVVEDSKLDITLTIKHPEKIRLIWEELA